MKVNVVDVTLSVREMAIEDTCPGCEADVRAPDAVQHRPWSESAGRTDVHACAACGHILALGTVRAPPELMPD